MLNLLFISDSPKAGYVKKILQPVLKVRIDVVTDFDHGLKEVFEKRPSTVCIQDQIGGVTGESVARHIKMLLGSGAPSFILLHAGSGKVKAIKGLYEHLVDLSQSDEAVAEDMKNTLQSLLGEQWEKIYIPPEQVPASAKPAVTVSGEVREDTERLASVFSPNLEPYDFSVVDEHPPVTVVPGTISEGTFPVVPSETSREHEMVSGTVESDRAQALNDDLAEILLMQAREDRTDEGTAPVPSVFDNPENIMAGMSQTQPELPVVPASPVPPAVQPPPRLVTAPFVPLENAVGTRSARQVSAPNPKPEVKVAAAPIIRPQTPATSPAAEFVISQNSPPVEDHISEDLLLGFEEHSRSKSLRMRRTLAIALGCIVCAAAAWYFINRDPFNVLSGAKQAPVAIAVAVPTPVPKKIPQLPAFIPKDGHDTVFASKNPGWERYVDQRNEFRVFTATGRIQAVQVLAVKDVPIPESLITSVVQECTGKQEYQITSRNKKAGLRVEIGSVQDKGEIMIYRQNGAVKAFVVSVN